MYVEKQQNNSQLNIEDETNIKWLFYIHKPLLTNRTTFIEPEFKKSGYHNRYLKSITRNDGVHFVPEGVAAESHKITQGILTLLKR